MKFAQKFAAASDKELAVPGLIKKRPQGYVASLPQRMGLNLQRLEGSLGPGEQVTVVRTPATHAFLIELKAG